MIKLNDKKYKFNQKILFKKMYYFIFEIMSEAKNWLPKGKSVLW